jgi:hypothetical protein
LNATLGNTTQLVEGEEQLQDVSHTVHESAVEPLFQADPVTSVGWHERYVRSSHKADRTTKRQHNPHRSCKVLCKATVPKTASRKACRFGNNSTALSLVDARQSTAEEVFEILIEDKTANTSIQQSVS